YCSNKNTSSVGEERRERKEDKEAVQMAYCCHHYDPERKDMPHDRNESANGVGKQGLSPDRHGIASRSDPAPLDRRAFGDLPDVGTTRAKNEYGHHDVLADRPACVSKALAAASLWQNGRALEFTRSALLDCQIAIARLPHNVHSNVSFALQHF